MLVSFEEDPLRDDYPDELVDEELRSPLRRNGSGRRPR
jgi:hypothetical protein